VINSLMQSLMLQS